MTGAVLQGLDLRNAELSHLDLSGVDLSHAYLDGVDLSYTLLYVADFTRSYLLGTNFTLAHYGAQGQPAPIWPHGFDDKNINALGPSTQLQNFNFPHGFNAAGVDLSDADQSGARRVDIHFSRANLNRVNFSEAVLSGALAGATIHMAQFLDTEVRALSSCPLLDEFDSIRCFVCHITKILIGVTPGLRIYLRNQTNCV